MPKCRITVVQKTLYSDLIQNYCDPDTVPCELFEVGESFVLDKADFFAMRLPVRFCSEAWRAISHYVFAIIQGAEIRWMHNGSMLACCNDGARPVVFLLERVED